MRFLIDAMLPPGLAKGLAQRGHDARHVDDVLGASASDAALFAEALKTGAILITKDRDFIDMAEGSEAAPQILWVRISNTTSAEMKERLETAFPLAEEKLAAGEPIVMLK